MTSSSSTKVRNLPRTSGFITQPTSCNLTDQSRIACASEVRAEHREILLNIAIGHWQRSCRLSGTYSSVARSFGISSQQMSSIASAPEVEAEAEANVIIRTMTYHRHDIDKKVISVCPVKQDKIKTCISTAFPVTSTSSSLGRLAVLPTELLFKVCLGLDIQSAFELRQVNCRARAVVTGVYEYRAIATHATGALSALFRTRMAKHIELRSLYKTLTEKWCVICGRFGGFLFIPTATRCCFTCLWDKSHFPVLTLKCLGSIGRLERKMCTGSVGSGQSHDEKHWPWQRSCLPVFHKYSDL